MDFQKVRALQFSFGNFNDSKMPSRKSSRNGFDYAATSYADPRYVRAAGTGGYPTVGPYAGYPAYPYTQPYYGYPTQPSYNGAYVNG